MDSLPDEMLLHVLALVDAPRDDQDRHHGDQAVDARKLLALRLVCRRWRHLALHRYVWRHRTVSLAKEGGASSSSRVMLLLPALKELHVDLGAYSHSSAKTRAVLGDLIKSRCQVRGLSLDVPPSLVTSRRLRRLLEERQPSLERLRLHVTWAGILGRGGWDMPSSLWEAVDGMSALTHLDIAHWAPFQNRQSSYRFRNEARRLRSVAFRFGVSKVLVLSLLDLHGNTLQEVDCGDYDLCAVLADKCPALHTLRARFTEDAVRHLQSHLRHLQRLQMTLRELEEVVALRRVLDARTASKDTSTIRQLWLVWEGLDAGILTLEKLARLRPYFLHVMWWCDEYDLMHALTLMSDLVELSLPVIKPVRAEVLFASGSWAEGTAAPRLEVLHVRKDAYPMWVRPAGMPSRIRTCHCVGYSCPTKG